MNKFEMIGEITDENISAAIQFLEAHKDAEEVVFYIDSPGGSVLDGLRLFRAMDNFNGKLIAEVGVMAASMAAFIALNCDEIHATKDSFLMVHQAWCVAEGTASDLMSAAALLEQASSRLTEIVAAKAKNPEAAAEYMSKDTWFGYQAMTECFNDITIVEENRFNKSIAASYALLKSEKPLELAAMLQAEEKEEEEKDEEKVHSANSDEDEPEKDEEPEEEEKEEPKAEVDNTFALGVLAKAEKYI